MRTVLLLGDSIRLGYQPAVVEALPEWSVYGPAENCRSSRDLAENLERWALTAVDTPTFVHVNAGLHDLRRREETGWRHLVPREEYRVRFGAVLDRLIRHPLVGRSRVIVATTTPVDAVRHNKTKSSHRHQEDVVAYNEALVTEAQQRGLAINDLCADVQEATQELLSPDGVHFTVDGYGYLGRRVATAIRAFAAATRR